MEWNGIIWDFFDELVDMRIVGFFEDVWCFVVKYLVVVDDIDVVGDIGGFGQVMGNYDVGDVEGIVEQVDQVYQDVYGDWILFYEWFVVEQDLWVQGDCLGQGDVVFYVVGKFVWYQFYGVVQVDGLKFYQDDVVDYFFWQLGMYVQWKCDVFEDVEIGEQCFVLEQYVELFVYVEQVVV